ncbi:limonene-1,2-epoxide hydrolase family protein [Gordonia sp. SL306]|uniref:limonene-1,2-epoxide hydrolase family protein n=1 Tax=Gordonia sp. SL306 TaxID=2995145 RepID=UPI00226EFB4D|nr:limonene-1,2-epoxide hydrolase family protein [Gordonia sp. SL306]WAC54543.1 nuclear transport factor 2 family protein [Gordonia sp. SL306]
MTSRTPIDIVTEFLDELARGDSAAALENVDENIAYTNVSTPTVHGKRKVAKVFSGLDNLSWAGFNYRMVNVSADGPVVLTERVDELRIGRVAMQFWVCGRFEIAEGRITVWRDYFDYWDMTKGLVKGLVAAVIPAAQRPLPAKTLTA